MFDFKISLSSFRLCRRKTKSPATGHFFSPVNPKVLEIAYPAIPSPPPTTPIASYCPRISVFQTAPVATTPELLNSPLGINPKEVKESETKKGFPDGSGLFGKDEKEPGSKCRQQSDTKSKSSSLDSFRKEDLTSSLSEDGAYKKMMKETLTVVQWSEQPYDDFKRSMLEMILEKQMFEADDLEQLLQCFLTLNDRNHHPNIVAAFTEIWEILFR